MDNEELVQRELQCPVCKEDFSFEEDKYPRLLPCLHIVGTDCLNKCVNGDQLTCPICEEIHEIKDENVDQLPRDYSRQNLEMYRQLKWDKNLVHCVEHESTKASFCCQTCGLFACDICSNNYHSRNGHVVSSLDEFDQNIQISQLHKNTLCDITGHSDKHIEFFCTECQRLICPKCYLEQHYTHEVTNYKSVYDDYLAKLRSICTRITEMKQATKELNGAAEDELQALDILADKELGKVRCVFNNHKLALDERKRTLETQVKGIRDDKQDVLKRQQYDLKNMEKCLEESLSRASDFQTFSNEKAFITNFSFVERRMQNAIEKPIDTTLSEQALLLFLETKHTKRFENETEHLGKIWPLPNLKYTVHPVILSTECLLVSIHFNDKRGTAVSIKDIKNYIQAVLLNDQHETIDRAITQIAIKENELLEIKGSIHEPGTYTLMVMIANSSIKKDGFTLIPEATGDKQYCAKKADAIDKQFEAMGIEEKQNDVDRAGVKAKEHFDKNASALTEEYLVKVDDSKDNGNSVKKRDFIDSEKFVEKEDSVCTEKLFGDGDSIEKENLFTKKDSEDMTELVEKHDTVDKGLLVDKQYSVVKEDYSENKEQLDRKRELETNDKKVRPWTK